MTDRELLKLAAKAAGIEVCGSDLDNLLIDCNGDDWNPLTNDGDALRLAVRLHIDLNINNGISEAIWVDEARSESHSIEVPCDEAFEGYDAKCAATRRAIVRAAAEMEK